MWMRRSGVIAAGIFAVAAFGCVSSQDDGNVAREGAPGGLAVEFQAKGSLTPLPETEDLADVVPGSRIATVVSCRTDGCAPTGRVAILAGPATAGMGAAELGERTIGYVRPGNDGISVCGMNDELMAVVLAVRDLAYGGRAIDQLGTPGTKEIVVERAGVGAYVTVPMDAFPEISAEAMTYAGDCDCKDEVGSCEHKDKDGVHWCERKDGCRTCGHGS